MWRRGYEIEPGKYTLENITEWPNGYLLQSLKKQTNKHTVMERIGAEVKRRLANKTMYRNSYMMHRLLREAPSKCACGRAGLYIVNHTTYCSKCKDAAVQRRTHAIGTLLDPASAALGRELRDQNRIRTDKEKHHKARGRK